VSGMHEVVAFKFADLNAAMGGVGLGKLSKDIAKAPQEQFQLILGKGLYARLEPHSVVVIPAGYMILDRSIHNQVLMLRLSYLDVAEHPLFSAFLSDLVAKDPKHAHIPVMNKIEAVFQQLMGKSAAVAGAATS